MITKLNTSQLRVGLFLFLTGILLITGSAGPLHAATLTVTTVLDEEDGSCTDGDCSLRDAVATAVSGDTIAVPSGSYVLTLGELAISKNLTLTGTGAAPVLDGNADSRVLQVSGAVSLTLNNIIVTNGKSAEGGGIALYGGSLNLVNSEVSGNNASVIGGGIYLGTSGTVTLISGKISQNTAVVGGGGLYNMSGSFVQAGGTIENNSAASGGGVYVNLPDAVYILNGGIVQKNSSSAAETGGGGVHVAQGTVTINGGQISENSGARGGGIQSANGRVILNGGAIKQNEASYGGGVYLAFPEALLTQNGGEISENVSTASDFGGGGVYGFQGSMALSGGLVHQNTAAADGGGINIRFGKLTITGGTVTNNQAGASGGGIFVELAALSAISLQLGNNTAAQGGGLYADFPATAVLTQTAVYSNTATANGGGLLLKGNGSLTNVTVSRNQADSGGGAWIGAGSVSFNNVTVAENSAASGGGIFNSSGTVTLHNTLLGGNAAASGPDCSGTAITSSGYNLVQNSAQCALEGNLTGNILNQDPLLQALTLYGAATYLHPLQAASPAIDAGDPANCPAADQHGKPRPLDGNMDDTAVCDIGAFEFGIPLRIDDVVVTEGNSGPLMANFPVTLDFPAPIIVTVAYASSNQSEVDGLDYTAVSGTLTFAPGQTDQTIAVPILGDLLDEDDETFILTLSNPTNAYLAKSQGLGTVVDNDPAPGLSVDDVVVVEGNSGSKTASFSVTLSAPSGKTVLVNYATDNGTALAGVDYTAVSGTLTFTPGQTSKTVTISVLGDLLDEVDELFYVNLTAPQNAAIVKGQGSGTIQDNDPLPVLTINNVNITETDGAPQAMQFTVTLSAASGKTVTVNYATADQTAVAGRDYTAKSGTLTFTPGQTSKIVSITVLNDFAAETTETFAVQLNTPVNAIFGDSQGIGTIIDNDPGEPTTTNYVVYLPMVNRP